MRSHVKQIRGKKTDVNDSLWLARICQLGLAQANYVPPRRGRHLRQLTRYRRKLVAERRRSRNRVHKTIDHDGVRTGGVLSDIFGVNGRRIVDGLLAGHPPQVMVAGLTNHVRTKVEPLALALAATLDPVSLLLLRMQVAEVDGTDATLAALDTRIRAELADHQRPCGCCRRSPASTSAVPPLSSSSSTRPGGLPGGSPSRRLSRRGARQQHPRRRAALGTGAPRKPDSAGHAGRMRHGAVRTKGSQFYDYHRAHAGRLGYKRAILATAHKLLRVIHSVCATTGPTPTPASTTSAWSSGATRRGSACSDSTAFVEEAQAAGRSRPRSPGCRDAVPARRSRGCPHRSSDPGPSGPATVKARSNRGRLSVRPVPRGVSQQTLCECPEGAPEEQTEAPPRAGHRSGRLPKRRGVGRLAGSLSRSKTHRRKEYPLA